MKKFSFLVVMTVLCASLSATAHVSKSSMSDIELRAAQKVEREIPFATKAVKEAAKKAPAEALSAYDFSNSVDFVEAAFWGTYTGESDDWVLYFADNNYNLIAYADVYMGDGTHIDGTVQMSDNSLYECSIVRAAGDTVDAVSATLTILHTSTAGTYSFNLQATDAAGNTYTISGDYPVDAYDYYLYYAGYSSSDITLEDAGAAAADYTYEPAAPAPVTTAFSGADANWDEDYYEDYGDVDLYLYDIDTTKMAALYFYVPSTYTTGAIPAGTYTINDTEDEWTVLASEGRIYSSNYDQYVPTAAMYATIINNGYYNDIWYIVSGYVQVSYDANGKQTIVVNALSGNGSNVIITYTEETGVTPPTVDPIEPESGFLNASAKLNVVKTFENGQVVITRNGVRYNVLGIRL